jgi:hypothetical protein
VKGFRTHRAMQVPALKRGPIDTAAIRASALREARKTVPAQLDSAEQRRVRVLATWLRKRCG